MAHPVSGTDVAFDATDDAVIQCPYPHYRAMRDDAPFVLSADRPQPCVTRQSRPDSGKPTCPQIALMAIITG